jgi:hypothetical protein
MIGWNFAPFDVHDHVNPETLRFKKYATGAHIVLQGNGVSTGQTSKEVAWQKDKVKLYRYESAAKKRYTVPVLLVYALILRPYILDLVPGQLRGVSARRGLRRLYARLGCTGRRG